MGKNLTEAQIAAAKQRMVGRAPPGVANRPSVDGFRSPEPLISREITAAALSKPKENSNKCKSKVS